MRNIFIFLCIGSLLGCQTQEFAYRMSIKDSLYRDDSLLAINVLQQLNAREKGDSVLTDSSNSGQKNMPISLFTLTKDLRYPEVEKTVDSTEETVSDSLPIKKEISKEKATTVAKPKTSGSTPAIAKPIEPAKTIIAPAKAPVPPAAKPAEVAKPIEPAKTPTPPASPAKQ